MQSYIPKCRELCLYEIFVTQDQYLYIRVEQPGGGHVSSANGHHTGPMRISLFLLCFVVIIQQKDETEAAEIV